MRTIDRLWQRLDSAVVLLLALFLLQYLLLFIVATPNWDAAYYYVYARSAVFDGDLELSSDLRLSYPTAGARFAEKAHDQMLNETGRMFSPFAIGSSLIWSPLFAVMRLIMAGLAALGITPEMITGYEQPYVAAISAFSALLGFLAFWLTYRFSRDIVGRRPALVAVITLMFVTPLLYYQFREPLYAHATAAFIMSLCIVVWYRQADRLPIAAGALLLGGLLGLGILVRWQHAVYCILPVASAAFWWLRLPVNERKAQWRRPVSYVLLTGIAVLLVVSLQTAKWRLFNGLWITIPQGDAFMDWSAPNVGPVLWSTFRGLLAWMPVFLPAVIGLLWLARSHPRLVIPLLLVLGLEVYVSASTVDWFGGGGYGTRRFTGTLLIVGLGYAGFLAIFRPRRQLIVGVPLGILLAWHQWILLRYGLAEQLGGRMLSGYPTFNWEAVSWPVYLSQLQAHLPAVWRNPRDFFLFPGSPLHLWLELRAAPWEHLWGLLTAALFVLCAVWIARRLQSTSPWPWLLAAGLFVLFANIWILWLA